MGEGIGKDKGGILSEILVRVGHVRVALEVLAVDKRLNTPFDDLRVRFEEGELAQHLGQQLRGKWEWEWEWRRWWVGEWEQLGDET